MGRTYIFNQGINKHAFPIVITKSWAIQFLLMLYHKFANATQVSFCRSNFVEVGECEKQTEQHPHSLTTLINYNYLQ